MSTKTGLAPVRAMAPAVAKKVYGVVITSSPGPMSLGHQADQQGVAAGGNGDGVGAAAVRGQLGLAVGHGRAEDALLALQHGVHRRADFLADRGVLGLQVEQRNGYRVETCSLGWLGVEMLIGVYADCVNEWQWSSTGEFHDSSRPLLAATLVASASRRYCRRRRPAVGLRRRRRIAVSSRHSGTSSRSAGRARRPSGRNRARSRPPRPRPR